MESSPTSEEVHMGTVMSEEAPKADLQTVENDADDTAASSEKKAKLDEGESAPVPVQKKRRSGGQRNRCDTDIIAEARAAYGELDASEGRRLRKRPEPKETAPKKASPGKSTSQRGRKKRVVAEEVKEEEDITKEEDSKMEDAENPPAEKPAATDDDDAAGATKHEDDVKEVAEAEVAPAETEEEKPATTETDLSGSTEATAADVSTLPAAEVSTAPADPERVEPAEPERVEEPETQTAEPQGLTESSAALAASE